MATMSLTMANKSQDRISRHDCPPEERARLFYQHQRADLLDYPQKEGKERNVKATNGCKTRHICMKKIWKNRVHSHQFRQDSTVEELLLLYYTMGTTAGAYLET